MEFEWEFFDKLDELVYVSEVDTYELVYMNAKAREVLGCQDLDSYRGQPCYQLLQGLDRPCPFCTNHLLTPGEFYAWAYENPVLDKRFLLKDTIIERGGKRYRLEIAIDVDAEVVHTNSHFYAHSEMIIGECLRRMFSTGAEDGALNSLLGYIGETFLCHRAYIFELNQKGGVDNTYEWCAEGVRPQIDALQDVPFDVVSWWFQMFEGESTLCIEDLEEIRVQYPMTYGVLKPQNISSLAAGPIYDDQKQVVGFLGVDNPDKNMLPLITPLLHVIGYFVSTLLHHRDTFNRLNRLSYQDQITGALNQNALWELCKTDIHFDSVGVLLCEVSALKKVNHTLGTKAGDELLIRCCQYMRQTELGEIYRMGADKFAAVCLGVTAEEFNGKIAQFRQVADEKKLHIIWGQAWSKEPPVSLERLIIEADNVLYQNKQPAPVPVQDMLGPLQPMGNRDTPFSQFIRENYCDFEAIFRSISMADNSRFLYFGDLQRNRFYISDNMRDTFGFSSNVVDDLLSQWESRIANPEHLRLYQQDVTHMLQEKRTLHDLRYQVRDVMGNVLWVRCSGTLQWDTQKGIPLFFSGIVSSQDNTFLVDPITNYPREHSALSALQHTTGTVTVVAFSLNHFSEINETKGRYNGNLLLEHISKRLTDNFGYQLQFYRLDGVRFIGVAKPGEELDNERLISAMRSLIEREYCAMGVAVRQTCSFGILSYSNESDSPHTVIENAIALLSLAKKHPDRDFFAYSPSNLQELKDTANMSMALSRDVMDEMQNFYVVIQPVVSTANGIPAGGEVLMRWKYKDRDVSPAVFIPLLEKGKNIRVAGKWVFEQAVRICRRLMAYNPSFYLTFNVSYHQIGDDDFINFVRQTLERYQVSGENLVAELTETHFDDNPEKLRRFVEECSKLKIRIALDDFGSGYSSLALLLKYPANIVKLDRSLLMEMTESVDKMNFISSIVYACHRFGKKVCMEGVETQAQDALIKESGCDMIQGYYYYRPMAVNDVYRLICNDAVVAKGESQ